MCVNHINQISFFIFRKRFAGVVVARLPFEPVSVFRNIAHTTIEGDDYKKMAIFEKEHWFQAQNFINFSSFRITNAVSSSYTFCATWLSETQSKNSWDSPTHAQSTASPPLRWIKPWKSSPQLNQAKLNKLQFTCDMNYDILIKVETTIIYDKSEKV